MRKILSLALIITLPLVTTSAAAADQADPATPAKEKKICRAETATGSIMPKRTCHTAVEWDAIDKANAAAAQASVDRRSNGNLQLGGGGAQTNIQR